MIDMIYYTMARMLTTKRGIICSTDVLTSAKFLLYQL